MAKELNVGVVGATGAVGKELLAILAARKFPVANLRLFSSPRSEGKEIAFAGRTFRVEVLKKGCFSGVDVAFFDASDAVSKEWVPEAASAGAWVVDNSATFRLEEDVPLLVPEVNGTQLVERLKRAHGGAQLSPHERILSGPNCSTVQLVLPLAVIDRSWGIERVLVSTYQAASGAGSAAMVELSAQTMGYLQQKPFPPNAFAHEIAFNCIPHIGGFKEDGYTSEEQKVILESRKILSRPDLRISATAVRVPTLSCHGESVAVECRKSFEIPDVRAALAAQAGIVVQDDPERKIYPMGRPGQGSMVEGATGRDAVYVGRLRKDHSAPQGSHGLQFWVVSDNLRKGAALNAIQIGEILVRDWF